MVDVKNWKSGRKGGLMILNSEGMGGKAFWKGGGGVKIFMPPIVRYGYFLDHPTAKISSLYAKQLTVDTLIYFYY